MDGSVSQPEAEAVEEEIRPSDEDRRIVVWRFVQSRRLGLSHVEARLFAESGSDLGLLRNLVARGCPASLALKIAL